jgi:hypothetical protein
MNQSCNPVIISDTAWHLQTDPKSSGSATAAWTHHKLFPLQDVDELKLDRELLFRDVEHRGQLMNSENQLSRRHVAKQHDSKYGRTAFPETGCM